MQKIAFSTSILSFCILLSTLTPEVFWLEVSCPAEIWKKLTAEEIGGKIQECLDARKNAQESSITEFHCPSGSFTNEDLRPLDENTIPYHVGVAVLFNEIDKDALAYMCDLREMREKDPTKWTEDIRKKIELTSTAENKPFWERYREVCDFSYIAGRINTKEKEWIISTNTYPQTICEWLADRKALAWSHMWNVLMTEGVAKSWQNDKDTFVDTVKWRYTIVYDKYLRYKRIAERAIKNLTALAEQTTRR